MKVLLVLLPMTNVESQSTGEVHSRVTTHVRTDLVLPPSPKPLTMYLLVSTYGCCRFVPGKRKPGCCKPTQNEYPSPQLVPAPNLDPTLLLQSVMCWCRQLLSADALWEYVIGGNCSIHFCCSVRPHIVFDVVRLRSVFGI